MEDKGGEALSEIAWQLDNYVQRSVKLWPTVMKLGDIDLAGSWIISASNWKFYLLPVKNNFDPILKVIIS